MTLSLRERGLCAAALVAALALRVGAVTRLASADGQYWDIQDTSAWSQDSGGIATGGGANPFNGFGYLKLRVRARGGATLVGDQYLTGFGLSHDDGGRLDSITPVLHGDVLISRGLFAPPDDDYLRYLDTYTNTADASRMIEVAWGGATGAFEDGGPVTVAVTSSGNRTIGLSETFVTVMQNANRVADPIHGPSGHGPSAHVLGSHAAGLLTGVGDMYADPFTTRWPGYDPAHIAYVFTLTLNPGQTVALMTFVVKGLSEVYDPRGGFPIPLRDALVAPKYVAPYRGAAPKIPQAGSEIARVTAIARRLVEAPDVRGLTPLQRSQVVNWRVAARQVAPFTPVEKTVPQIAEALARGETTSEDVVREYLGRLTQFDRHGPTLRSMLALNPAAIADARRLDAERAASGARGPMHGVPVIFKDNIDVLGLPTTGGSRALVEHRPRLDSRVAAGMRKGGVVVIGKANLDEFPFGDFGIRTLGGTIGNAYDPSLSTAGSSGGSATAVATSLAALGFGTDTCNSLSNPSGFASLATIRVTRGLVSRAGVMPLNPYNDAVGPMAKCVRDVALAIDQVAGTDPEDTATADADTHINGSFAEGLNTATLKGRRIGVLRQRFVGVTGEREVATEMDRVIKEFTTAGGTVLDVTIPDYDAKFRAARGSAPGALKAGWIA